MEFLDHLRPISPSPVAVATLMLKRRLWLVLPLAVASDA